MKRQKPLPEVSLFDDWVSRAVQNTWEAMKLPGDVFTGKVDPSSDEAVRRATDLAGALSLGGLARGAASPIPNSLGVFGLGNTPGRSRRTDLPGVVIKRKGFRPPNANFNKSPEADFWNITGGRDPRTGELLPLPDRPSGGLRGAAQNMEFAGDRLRFDAARLPDAPETTQISPERMAEAFRGTREGLDKLKRDTTLAGRELGGKEELPGVSIKWPDPTVPAAVGTVGTAAMLGGTDEAQAMDIRSLTNEQLKAIYEGAKKTPADPEGRLPGGGLAINALQPTRPAEAAPAQDAPIPAATRSSDSQAQPSSLSGLSNEELVGLYEKKAPKTGAWGAGMAGAIDSASFGTDDEIIAAIQTLGGLLGDYSAARDEWRAYKKTAAEEHPVANTAGAVGGALTSLAFPGGGMINAMKVAPKLASGAGRMARVGNAAQRTGQAGVNAGVTGAAYGAAYGAGSAEGGLGDRLGGAASGAGSGALTGAAVSTAGRALAPVVKSGARAAAAPFRRVVARNTEYEANRALGKAVDQGTGGRGDLAAQRLGFLRQQGTPAIVADVGGEPTRNLAARAARLSDEGGAILKDVTTARSGAPAVERLAADLQQVTGAPPNAIQHLEQLRQRAQRENAPNYQRAMAAPAAARVWSPELQNLTQSQTVRDAIQRAVAISSDEAAARGQQSTVRNPFIQAPDGTLALPPGVFPNLEFWDAVKKGINQVAGESNDPNTRRLANNLADRLVNILDGTPGLELYRAARGHAEQIFEGRDALQAGMELVTEKLLPSQIRQRMAQFPLNSAERRLVEEGFITRMVEDPAQLRKLMSTPGQQTPESTKMWDRMDAVLGPQRTQAMRLYASIENQMQLLNARIRSGGVQNIADALGGGLVGGGIAGTYTGSYTDPKAILIGLFSGGLARQRARALDEKVARRLADMLTSGDPQVIQRALEAASKNPQLFTALKRAEVGITRLLTPTAETGSKAASADDKGKGEGRRQDQKQAPRYQEPRHGALQ